MIGARKSRLFEMLCRPWLLLVMRKRFHNVYIVGADHLRSLDGTRSIVGCVNHTNWWDGFMLYALSHARIAHEPYLAMDERTLRRYRFFTRMGVFGLDLSSPRTVLPGLRFAVRLLKTFTRAPRLVWIFVQGRLLHPRLPIEAKPGAQFLATRSGALLLPIVLRYEWLMESQPSVFIHVGAPLPADTSPEVLSSVMNDLFRDVDPVLEPGGHATCEALFPTKLSISDRWKAITSRSKRQRPELQQRRAW